MKPLILLFVLGVAQQSIAQSFDAFTKGNGYVIHYHSQDSSAKFIDQYVSKGMQTISKELNRNFKNTINVYIFRNRKQLDEQWQQAWQMPGFNSECWMVGSGVSSRLDLLSPSAWKDQACDHNPEDKIEIEQLVVHELTHILHSDYNRSPEFDEINNIDWFVEGLATFISGQLNNDRLQRTRKYVVETGAPTQLAEFWKGEHKYGLSGSMVAYIEQEYGMATIGNLLEFNDIDDILNELRIPEEALIENWKKYLRELSNSN